VSDAARDIIVAILGTDEEWVIEMHRQRIQPILDAYAAEQRAQIRRMRPLIEWLASEKFGVLAPVRIAAQARTLLAERKDE
jgi:hypothetical protein